MFVKWILEKVELYLFQFVPAWRLGGLALIEASLDNNNPTLMSECGWALSPQVPGHWSNENAALERRNSEILALLQGAVSLPLVKVADTRPNRSLPLFCLSLRGLALK